MYEWYKGEHKEVKLEDIEDQYNVDTVLLKEDRITEISGELTKSEWKVVGFWASNKYLNEEETDFLAFYPSRNFVSVNGKKNNHTYQAQIKGFWALRSEFLFLCDRDVTLSESGNLKTNNTENINSDVDEIEIWKDKIEINGETFYFVSNEPSDIEEYLVD